jgi:hypothetical protein
MSMWAGEQEQYNGETHASGPPIAAERTEKVAYNVQTVVDAKHHLYVEREVTTVGSNRAQLSRIALSPKNALGKPEPKVLVDRRLLQPIGNPIVRTGAQSVCTEIAHLDTK